MYIIQVTCFVSWLNTTSFLCAETLAFISLTMEVLSSYEGMSPNVTGKIL